ncbi:MAG: 50S ribosomal protein L44e [archaeon]
MKIPKEMSIFCKWCKTHTIHTVESVKKKQKRTLSHGQRRFDRKMTGYGSFPKPMPDGKKPTQRQDLRYKCKDCKNSITRQKTYRTKKFEVIDNA